MFRGGILPPRKTPRIHARRPCGVCPPPPPLRRGPEGQVQDQQRMHRLFEPCRSGGSREPLLVPLWERLQPQALATRGKCLPARKPKTKPAPTEAGFTNDRQSTSLTSNH